MSLRPVDPLDNPENIRAGDYVVLSPRLGRHLKGEDGVGLVVQVKPADQFKSSQAVVTWGHGSIVPYNLGVDPAVLRAPVVDAVVAQERFTDPARLRITSQIGRLHQ